MEKTYSIKDLERFTGIKAHTLRAWESRHGLIEPERTEGNVRYYTPENLRRALNVASLVNTGMRISAVAEMEDEELSEAVMESRSYSGDYIVLVNALKSAMLDFDDAAFNATFANSLALHGTQETLTKVLADFMEQVGVLWQVGAITEAHEHFVSALTKQKISAMIDRVPTAAGGKNEVHFALFLPHQEMHEIGLLYLHYALKISGCSSLYLGQGLPLEALKEVAEKRNIRKFITVFTSHPNVAEMPAYLEKVAGLFDPAFHKFHLSGYQAVSFPKQNFPENFKLYPNIRELKGAVCGKTQKS